MLSVVMNSYCLMSCYSTRGRAQVDCKILHVQAQLTQLEASAGNLLGQLGALCAEQLRKATILQGECCGSFRIRKERFQLL